MDGVDDAEASQELESSEKGFAGPAAFFSQGVGGGDDVAVSEAGFEDEDQHDGFVGEAMVAPEFTRDTDQAKVFGVFHRY